ncbi:predicted protein [Streptomyces viridochromogenes DSM 40736]|uniref:Predicted protein n=1 Tax=Streptomyces viridochromogenes (strain DSM 40736 / JCM 4977 / BCRC 1201 / Tue 494) TaxID=591159 RepID=D9X709_STRVT|nr:hypothetical protein [Streptomyces viridochromogenes]EFL34076.1 predicted protein [Streptomyces viridochromogenes DSM 40736]
MVDPNFSGINPGNLLRTIKNLESSIKNLHAAKSSYASRFRKLGLETSNLTEIAKIASWVDDELPMLRRRQALAAAMELDHKGIQKPGAMVQLREPISTMSEARGAGKELAEEANRAAQLDPSIAGPEFHRIAEELTKHTGDPDFTSTFFAKMDPDLVKNLPMTIVRANALTVKDDVKVFGAAFTTAVNAETPAPGFDKGAALFHGQFTKDEPMAVFNRALMQGDDPELWDLAWKHTQIAAMKLLDPADTWSDSAGLLASVIGFQSNYANHFWEMAQAFSGEAAQLKQQRLNAMSKADRRRFKNATTRAAKASAQSARDAERILSKYGMGPLSRLMEASIADGGSWLINKVPELRPRTTSLWGRTIQTGGKLPLVGSLLTIGAIGWDISNGEEKDVAVAANVGGMAAGMGATWGTTALVALAGGPVGWGIAAGVVVGFGIGYAASYLIKSETGKKAVNAVTGAARSAGNAIGNAASGVRNTVGGWFP